MKKKKKIKVSDYESPIIKAPDLVVTEQPVLTVKMLNDLLDMVWKAPPKSFIIANPVVMEMLSDVLTSPEPERQEVEMDFSEIWEKLDE